MRRCLLHQHRNCFVVQNIACVIDDTVLAVRGIRVQRHVRDYCQIRQRILECAERPLYQSLWVSTLGAIETLQIRIDHRKKGNSRDAERGCCGRFL